MGVGRLTYMAARTVVLCTAAGVLLFYVNRLFSELPVYPGDEGAYLIRALYERELTQDPYLHPALIPVANTAYFAVIRLVDLLSANVLPWMRLLSVAAYFGGLCLLASVAIREAGQSKAVVGFVLVALAFPYYRFVFVVMPDGAYAGLLCLIFYAFYRTYGRRPLSGAMLVGGLSAILVLTKPHGVVVAPAYAVLVLADALIRRTPLRSWLCRLIVFAIAFFVVGVGIELAAGRPIEVAVKFFAGSAYAQHLGRATVAGASAIASLSALGMVSLCAILTAVPVTAVLTGLWRERAASSPEWRPGLVDLTFLFALLCMGATVAMVTIFSLKVASNPDETHRLWGRYFEFFVPMLWLLAAGRLSRWPDAGKLGRLLAAGVVFLGLCGLLATLACGVRLYPWDATAVTAFASPDVVKFPFGYIGGSRLIAVLATVAVALATFAGLPLRAIWLSYFVLLGLLSTRADDAWAGEVAHRWRTVEHELHVAGQLVLGNPPRTVVVANDGNEAQIGFLRLGGRASVRITPPGTAHQMPLRRFRSAIVFDSVPLGPGWRQVFDGEEIDAYVREAPTP